MIAKSLSDQGAAIKVVFLGTSGAFNEGARAHSCYWVEDALGTYMVDFGPTALLQCRRFGLDPDRLDAIYLTHLHGDHIGGLPVLLLDLQYNSRRTRPLSLGGPPGTAERLSALMDASYPASLAEGLGFPLSIARWSVPGEISLNGRTIRAIRAMHDRHAVATSLRIETAGRALAFSGDTGWQPALATLSAGVELFVCEASSATPGYWAHLSVEELLSQRASLSPKRLVLSHMSAAARQAAGLHQTELGATIADDGLTLILD